MMRRGRGRLLAPGIAALALTFAVTGCGAGSAYEQDTDATGGQAASQPTPEKSPEQSAEKPSPEPAPSASPVKAAATKQPTPDEKETQQVAPGIRGKLLTADEVPGFNDRFTWREKSTRLREGRSPFGTCHKFAMTSIGAMRATVRRYVPTGNSPGSTASHLVAEFADEMTAKRAYEVLKSWRSQCAAELKQHDRADVGRLEPVSLDGDEAVGNWYLLTYGPAAGPDSSYFDAQGLTRVGRTVAVLQMRLEGQDYNYPAGKEPMVAAVQQAAARLG